ncbi:uncharacterized protein E0L32_005071 [Thyridium curvatum]|uniref:Major facilitator superfamily (MFS) profile domain-containing protein n=1 Tax=Thyridium curvatum TaxID=1093900 RepID=A0A507B6F1_9PEZI|nr:uncharacterized protein E0L32_005071 [Thyridium curvatum]TPX14676.1 hypothetical protein E0L32_005071 [Thyridium curvatum]
MPASSAVEPVSSAGVIEATVPPSERSSVSELDWIDKEKEALPEPAHGFPAHTFVQIGDTDTGVALQVSLGPEALDPKFSLSGLLQRYAIEGTDVLQKDAIENKRFQSPFTWPMRKKMVVLSGTFLASLLSAYSAGAYALAAEPLRQRWHVTDTEYNIGITLFVAGFGFSPMILAPVSEAHGRYWVFVGSGLVFFFGTLGCAVTSSYPGMLVSRLVTGCGAAVYAALTGGVVSDLYHKEHRNTPMTLYSLSIMFGTGMGPLVSGAVVDSLGWHWIFYLQLIAIGVTTTIIFFFFEETRSNVILTRKCQWLNGKKLRRAESRQRVLFAVGSGQALKVDISILWTSFAFPLRLLATESVVFWFSLWLSFAWCILYMQFSSIGFVFRRTYDFSSTEVGAVYTSVIVGAILGSILAVAQAPITRLLLPRSTMTNTPEQRLLSPCVQSIFLPIGLFWFGWTSRQEISWISPAIAIGSCTLGIFSIYLAVFDYLADTYHRYASSAIAASSMCRNILAGIFPLITSKMLTNLTLGGAGSLLGGLGVLLTIIPWLLFFFGRKIRARSPFARELQDS